MARKKVIEKKASVDEAVSRMTRGSVGYNGLKTINGYIYEEGKVELRWPECIKTFKRMSYDSTIVAANNAIDVLISRVKWKFAVPDGASEAAQEAAKFLTYCMDNMDDQTWRQFINEVGSYRVYGYHVAEKIFSEVKRGKWQGKLKWRNLATRAQDTIGEWKWADNDPDKIVAAVQDLSLVGTDLTRYTNRLAGKTDIEIPRNKIMLFRYNVKKNNPMGTSPLLGCYIPWKQKTAIEEYELVGVSKDLGGLIDIGISADYLAKAYENPTGPEAQVIAALQQNATDMHAGDQTFVQRPISYDDNGKPLFEFNLLGVQGGGKQFDLNAIINRKQNEMLTVFMADVLKMGQDKVGSYSLSDTKTNLLSMGVQCHLDLISDTVNTDLVPQTLALNGWLLEQEEMPFLTYEDLEDQDRGEYAKALQQASAVNMILPTPEAISHTHKIMGIPGWEKIAQMSQIEIDSMRPENRTGAAGGMDEGLGNGDGSSTTRGADRSASNLENK